MANNYNQMTGVLFVEKITPVILALFAIFKVSEYEPRQASIQYDSEDSDLSWSNVENHLLELMNKLDIQFPAFWDESIEGYLYVLAKHFGVQEDQDIVDLIEHGEFDNEADLEGLQFLAKKFDDGHGLTGYKTEGAWTCSSMRPGEFGGYGTFSNTEVRTMASSNDVTHLGESLSSALRENDVVTSSELIFQSVNNLLLGIHDKSKRQAVTAKLSELLASSAAVGENNEEL